MILPGIPQFPIRVEQHDGKWTKRPLTKKGHLDATMGGRGLDYSRANGTGLVMGDGFYCIDFDGYKEGPVADVLKQWTADHGVPTRTRKHRTPSGGWHFFYRLPKAYCDLPSRNPLMHGVDTRGQGGWIAFAPGLYEVVCDAPLAELSPSACCAILQGSAGGGDADWNKAATGRDIDPEGVLERLNRMMVHPRGRKLAARWRGDTSGLRSGPTGGFRSELDISLAQLLSFAAFKAEEIVWLLLTHFEHGQARYLAKGSERAARRCAAKAVNQRAEEHEQLYGILKLQDEKLSPEDEAELLRRLAS